MKGLSAQLDAGWASLMDDLAERGLLESTTILWMGEFGSHARINESGGRDHFPNAWTCVLAGGGIRGGAGGGAYGRTSDDGMTVEEGKVAVGRRAGTTLCTEGGWGSTRKNKMFPKWGGPLRSPKVSRSVMYWRERLLFQKWIPRVHVMADAAATCEA